MRFPKPYSDFVQRFRVPGGFLLLAAFVLLSNPSWRAIAWGMPWIALGIALRIWAAGHLEKNQTLTISGPYAYTRNPLYLGSLIVTAGFLVASQSWWLAAIFTIAFVLIYLPVMELEADHLKTLFAGYDKYAARVPLLLPKPGPAGSSPFRWAVFKKNKEHKAIAGMLFGIFVLVVKLVWFPSI